MSRPVQLRIFLALLFCSWATTSPLVAQAPPGATPSAKTPCVKWGDIPLSFEPNVGQEPAEVRYLARGSSYTLYLADAEMVLSGRNQSPMRMKLLGANPAPRIVGDHRQLSTSNYLIGNDPSQWHTSVLNYGRAQYRSVYPGIDLVYYGHDGNLEYDWIVSPSADPRSIRLSFDGADHLRLDKQGNLVVELGKTEYQHRKPVVYQEVAGKRVEVSGSWQVRGKEAGFRIGAYDRSQPLVIDPVLYYSTYLGGSGLDNANAIAVDGVGNTYVTGGTGSADFPTANPLQASLRGVGDVFVTKINASGSARLYSTFLGSTGVDEGKGIAVNSHGEVYVTGSAGFSNFPLKNAIQSTWGGSGDAFLTKLNASGSGLVYSTYLGGSSSDVGNAIALDPAGNAYVIGVTFSTNFPTVAPFQATKGLQQDAFVAKINPAGSAWVYATYLGGNGVDEGYGIAVDAAGSAYLTGETGSTNFPVQSAFQASNASDPGAFDEFVTKLNPAGSALVYSTYLGGSGTDYGTAIAVDATGSAYVTGIVTSDNFPLVNPIDATLGSHAVDDVFVTKFNPSGSALVYSTYLGGGSGDDAYAIALDRAGNVYITGRTNSSDFPLVNPIQVTRFAFDMFVTEINQAGSAILFSTFVGGSGSEAGRGIAVDFLGNIHIAGETTSTDFPVLNANQTTSGGLQDAFVLLFATRLPFLFNDFAGKGCSDGEFLYSPPDGASYTALSNGDGTYSYVSNTVSPGFDIVRTGDFTGDGKADLVLYNSQTAEGHIGSGNGDGTFNFQALPWSPGYDFVETGDLNGDGKTDVVLYNSHTGSMYTGISHGDGTFTYTFYLLDTNLTYLRIADFTGDGSADLFLYGSATGTSSLGVGRSIGALTFQAVSVSPGYDLGDAGDLNGDGIADLILYNSSNGQVALRLSDGAGGFTFIPEAFVPGFTSFRLADYTGDGNADLTVYNKTSGAGFLGIGTGTGSFIFQSLSWSPGYDWVIPEDVNCDGRVDVILYNSATGTEYTGLSNGDGTFNYSFSYWGTGKVLVDQNHPAAPVVPVAPHITWLPPADITFGTALGATQLNATADVPGTFVYTPATGTVLNAGNGQTLSVTFTPNDAVHYTGATATVTINVLPSAPACAGDAGGQVAVTRGGFVFNPGTGRFSQSVRVTNTSGATIAGPIAFVLDNLGSNAALFNPTGVTGCTSPSGSPFIEMTPGGLATGASVTVILQFTNPTKAGITYQPRVLVGPGSR